MLKKLANYLFAGLLCMSFVGCGEHDEVEDLDYDFTPIQICVMAESQDGKDLLNPDVDENILTQNIVATYRGKEYTNGKSSKSRVYVPHFYGLVTLKLNNGKYALSFGELNGQEDFKNEEIVIDWGDGEQDVITFTSTVNWKGQRPEVKRSYQLNGKEVAKDTAMPIMKVVK